jgi:hypothetical protein
VEPGHGAAAVSVAVEVAVETAVGVAAEITVDVVSTTASGPQTVRGGAQQR